MAMDSATPVIQEGNLPNVATRRPFGQVHLFGHGESGMRAMQRARSANVSAGPCGIMHQAG